MKKIFFTVLVLIIICFSVSCGETSRDPLAYQTGNISAEIVILKNGCRIGATLHITESGDVIMKLTSPEAVLGTEIKRVNGEASVSRGDISLKSEAFLAVAELFRLDGDVISAEPSELDGKKLTKMHVLSGNENYEVYLSENNTPSRIVSGELTVDVIWFEGG